MRYPACMAGTTQTELHPWNRDFKWEGPRGELRGISPEQARHFDEDDYLVIPDAFKPEELAEVIAEIDPIEAQVEGFLRTR
ncbi:MAG: hypothetical protein GY946_06975 [bacterium]|nr:hypothetical protein [bacterium]